VVLRVLNPAVSLKENCPGIVAVTVAMNFVGEEDGLRVGFFVGEELWFCVGEEDGLRVGFFVGEVLGFCKGNSDRRSIVSR
jgi:hypothetical protein